MNSIKIEGVYLLVSIILIWSYMIFCVYILEKDTTNMNISLLLSGLVLLSNINILQAWKVFMPIR